ncbi:peptidase inhibitor family I36 protein [Streptomyces sp. CA-253872]|uniref:peptidase inhibitor family I36 protein n=1 Tax=Streptomyces sp. CA-253872 TaxID=3240067 RepID=UPI003D949E05
MRKRYALSCAGALLALTAASGVAAAGTSGDVVQRQIDAVLAATEGGVQISPYEIAWNGGEVIEAFPLPGEASARLSSPAAERLQASLAAAEPVGDVVTEAGPGAATAAGEPVATEEREGPLGPLAAASSDSCPTQTIGNDWYCFYQFKNYEGRRLQWNARHTTTMYFSDYAFVNATSSWSNRGGMTISVGGRTVTGSDASCRPSSPLWREAAHTRSASLPASLDNRADCFATS